MSIYFAFIVKKSFTMSDILTKLESVIDPELGLNIVEMGLIYDVTVHPKKPQEQKSKKPKENQTADIKMTFTTPACPMMNHMLDEIKAKLDEIPDADICVHVVFEPPWSTDRLSKNAKLKLGMI